MTNNCRIIIRPPMVIAEVVPLNKWTLGLRTIYNHKSLYLTSSFDGILSTIDDENRASLLNNDREKRGCLAAC